MDAVWLENRVLSFRDDIPEPEPPPGEALIRLRLGGICGTDLELVRGYYPYAGVLGHEFVGEVVTAPSQTELEGKRVVGAINAVCHKCEPCLTGRSTHCRDRTVLGIANRDGAFADFLTLPVENLSVVPDEVPDKAAVFVEPLASALQIQEQVHIRPSHRVLMIGAGRLGQLIGQTLSLTGAEVHVVARYEKQRRLLAPYQVELIEEMQVAPKSYDVVVEVTGSASGFSLAKDAVRAGGIIVLKSTYKGSLEINISQIVVDEITLVGSRCGVFEPAINLLATKMVDPTPLIENQYPLGEALAAFAEAGKSGVMKILLAPGS